jgi:hypothetical protein
MNVVTAANLHNFLIEDMRLLPVASGKPNRLDKRSTGQIPVFGQIALALRHLNTHNITTA